MELRSCFLCNLWHDSCTKHWIVCKLDIRRWCFDCKSSCVPKYASFWHMTAGRILGFHNELRESMLRYTVWSDACALPGLLGIPNCLVTYQPCANQDFSQANESCQHLLEFRAPAEGKLISSHFEINHNIHKKWARINVLSVNCILIFFNAYVIYLCM